MTDLKLGKGDVEVPHALSEARRPIGHDELEEGVAGDDVQGLLERHLVASGDDLVLFPGDLAAEARHADHRQRDLRCDAVLDGVRGATNA